MLSQEEVRKADAFRLDNLRSDYIQSHAALRLVLSECTGMDPAAIKLTVVPPSMPMTFTAAASKPAIDWDGSNAATRSDVRFNLSHTSGAALIAVSLGREVGVDIEKQRSMNDMDAIAQSVFSREEWAQWESLEEEFRMTMFYRVWTRKEAYLKAIGLGIFHELQDVTVPKATEPLRGVEGSMPVNDRVGGGEWRVADVPVGSGWSAAVCWQGDGVKRLQVEGVKSLTL